MATRISRTLYKDLDAIKIESEALEAVVIPGQGAKLASLKSLSSGKEFLLQRPGAMYRRSTYDSDYLAGECSGFDEICPTMLEFFYDKEPWKGIRIPDHGEVWSLPWHCETDSESLVLSVHGLRLPYRLSKRITLAEPDCLRLSYVMANESAFPIDFIWCAHIMLEAGKGCRILAPRGMDRCVATMSDSGAIGEWGEEFDYPVRLLNDGSHYDASLHRGDEANDYQKFFFKGRLPEGRAGLLYPDGHILTLRFPEREVPCFAAIQAEGGKLAIRCVFLEPSTAAYDRPDLARLKGLNSVLPPEGQLGWHLDLKVTLPS